MEYTITCNGIPVGIGAISRLAGLAHARVRRLPGYDAVREHALRAGRRLGYGRQLWSSLNGDFGEEFARTWSGGRLGLIDALGVEIGVASVMLIEGGGREAGPGPHVVVDARPDMARVEAFLRSIDGEPGGGSRPAA